MSPQCQGPRPLPGVMHHRTRSGVDARAEGVGRDRGPRIGELRRAVPAHALGDAQQLCQRLGSGCVVEPGGAWADMHSANANPGLLEAPDGDGVGVEPVASPLLVALDSTLAAAPALVALVGPVAFPHAAGRTPLRRATTATWMPARISSVLLSRCFGTVSLRLTPVARRSSAHHYTAAGPPNQVVSASASPADPESSPTQAT
jgi:hypothetical protein